MVIEICLHGIQCLATMSVTYVCAMHAYCAISLNHAANVYINIHHHYYLHDNKV